MTELHDDEVLSTEEMRERHGEIDLSRQREGGHRVRADFYAGGGRSAANSAGRRQAARQRQHSRLSPEPRLRVPIQDADPIQSIPKGPKSRPPASGPALYDCPGDSHGDHMIRGAPIARHIPLYSGPWDDNKEDSENLAEPGRPLLEHSRENTDGSSWGNEGEGQPMDQNTQPHGSQSNYEHNGSQSDYDQQREEFHYQQNGEDNQQEGESDKEENLEPSQSSPHRARAFRERNPRRLPLPRWCSTTKPTKVIKKNKGGGRRAKWSDQDLISAMECYNLGYKISECCEAFNIPRSSLRDHLSGRTTTRKIGAKTTLTNQEEQLLIQYIDDMLEVGQPLTPQMLKLKVAEICQGKLTPFKDGIPGDSWFFWFKQRHPHLVMRMPQGLEVARAKAMNPSVCHGFYKNLLQLYNKFAYPPSNIWNVDESGCNASKSGLDKVLARKGVRSVYAQIPNEREWLSILTSINAAGWSILHFYIFKGKRRLRDYIHLCEAGSTMAMQEKGYMTSYLFCRWMDHFIEQLEAIGDLSPSNRHLVILDGHKSHVSLEVIQKAKHHGIDMISLPSHTSHALQPLDVACFKPFKIALKAYRNKWMLQNSGRKVEKEILAQWVDLSLKKALSANNIRNGFRATGIWPLSLDKMEAKVGPSKPYNSLPSEKVIVEDIMKKDIPSVETNAKHYYVEDDDDVEHGEGVGAENTPPITDFLKLPPKTRSRDKSFT